MVDQSEWTIYRRKGHSQGRPYIPGEDMRYISVNSQDVPIAGGMVFRNPADYRDQWYVSQPYFEENLEEVE